MPTTLWRKREESAVIIDDSGSAVICDHCPCCDGVVEFDRELAHAYDSVPVKVTVTLQPGCFDKDGVTSASLYFTSTVYADESRITVLFEEARRYTLGSAGNHPVPDEYSVNPITGVVKYAWYFYVGPEAVTSIFVNLVQPKGELEDNLSYAEIAYSSDVKLEVDSADDEPCVGDYISHSFTFSPTEALAGYGIVISLSYFPAVEATVTTDGDVELSDNIPTDLAGEMGWGPLYIVVPGLIHIEYTNSDTEQELGEYTIVPGSTISVSAPTLNTCGDADTLSITIACLAEAKAEAVTVEVYDGEDKIENIGDYIEESGGTPFSFGTGWIYDSGTATYSFSKEVVALPRNSAASLSIVAKVEVPSSVEDTNLISSEDTLSIYLPDTQVSITAPTLDLYKGVGTLKIVVFCVDENDFTPPSVSFSMGGTPVDINDYAEWDDESMINFAVGNWVISGGDATWEYDLEANDRADPGDEMTITVTYLGVDYTGTITFDVEGTLRVTIPPMHRYGVNKIISVEIVNAPRAWSGTPSFTKNGPGAFSDHVQWMTSASWDASTWLRTARGIGEGATFSVNVEYMKLPVVTKTVTIKDEVLCGGYESADPGIAADWLYSMGITSISARVYLPDSEKINPSRLPALSVEITEEVEDTVEVSVPAGGTWAWSYSSTDGDYVLGGQIQLIGAGWVSFKVFVGGIELYDCADTCEVKDLIPEGTITTCPEVLHTLGDNTVGKSFVATVTQCSSAPSISIEDDNGGSLHGTIGTIGVSITETETGSGEWNISCGLYANSIPADLPVHIKIMSGDMELAECTVDVTDVLVASVTMPSYACLEEPIRGIQIFIGGVDGEYIPRFVYGTHAIVAQECDPEGAITLVKSGTDSFWSDVDGFTYLSGGVWQWGESDDTEVAQSISGTYLTELPATVTLTVEQIREGEANTEISNGGGSIEVDYTVTITGPGNMHVAGCSKWLTITAPCYEHAGLPEISVFDSNDQSFHSFIGDAGSVEYGYLIFGESLWVDGVWSYALRISSVSADNPITIRASKYGTVVAETTFSTSNRFNGTITGRSYAYKGKSFSVSINITAAAGGPLCHFDRSQINITTNYYVSPLDFSTPWTDEGAGGPFSGTMPNTNDDYIISVKHPDGTLICSHTVIPRDTHDEDDIPLIDINVTSAPERLHIYGNGGVLSVNVRVGGDPPPSGYPGYCVVSGDLSGLELVGGGVLSFAPGTWSNGVWSGAIQATSGAAQGNRDITFTYTYGSTTVVNTVYLYIDTDLQASISAPSSVGVNAPFTVTINVYSNEGSLPRLPSDGGVNIFHGNSDDSGTPTMTIGAGSSFTFVQGVCTLIGCRISAECFYEIEVQDKTDDQILDIGTIRVGSNSSCKEDLAEAINERTGSTYTGAEPIGTLASAASNCAYGFIVGSYNGGSSAPHTYSFYDVDPPSFSAAAYPDEDARCSAAYSFVCSLKDQIIGLSYNSEFVGGNGRAYMDFDIENGECVPAESESTVRNRAKSMSRERWGVVSDPQHTWSANADWQVVEEHECFYHVQCGAGKRRTRFYPKNASSVSRKITMYGRTAVAEGTMKTHHTGMTLATGVYWAGVSWVVGRGSITTSRWDADDSRFSANFGEWGAYRIYYDFGVCRYRFKH